MEPRFQRRKEQLLAECQVPPALRRGVMIRLEAFAPPFVASRPGPESRSHSRTSLAGRRSDVERKNAESIASRDDLDRQAIPRSLGEVAWGHEPRIAERTRQVARDLGRPGAVLVIDPSAVPKKGTASVGVQRPWRGRLGAVEDGQVGAFLGSVSDTGRAPVDVRLFLPGEWAKGRERRQKSGAPKGARFHARPERALGRLRRRGPSLPHGRVAGDGERGRPAWPRARLAADKERYLRAVPSNTAVRGLEGPPPPYGGHGRRPEVPFRGVRARCEARPAGAWTKPTVRDGEKGPLEVEIVARRVESTADRRVVGFEAMRVVIRSEDGGVGKHDYHPSHAAPDTPRSAFARVATASHRIAGCWKRSSSEAGRGESQVRNWWGWHPHMALSLIATWFLVGEARGGKKGASQE